MMRRIRPTLALLSLAALLILAGVAAVQNFSAARQMATTPGPDEVALWEERLKGPLRDLPDELHLIGYVSRRDLLNTAYDAADTDREFALTQYVLAPRIVQEPGLDNAYVLANLPDVPIDQVMGWMVGHNLMLVNDYGDGIFLFRKVNP